MDKGDLARIPGTRKHAFAKESRPEANAVESTDQVTLMPSFDTKAVTTAV
jgi:hypothetical protein